MASDDLLHQLEVYRARYAGWTIPPEVEQLELAMGRRRHKVATLEARVSELEAEITSLQSELVGIERGYEALISDAIDRLRTERHEGLSPMAVVGYRLWAIRDDGLYGARERWQSAAMVASCRRGGTDLPHSDGRCGRLGCGVYAVKDLQALLAGHTDPDSRGFVAGRVELSGKVVEHEHGYRAERAEVVSAVAVGAETVAVARTPSAVEALFQTTEAFMTTNGSPIQGPVWATLVTTLIERTTAWTSENRPA